MNTNITIDSEFRSLIPSLTPDEYKRLETSIIEEGCRDALVVWPNIDFANDDYENDPDPYVIEREILIDGHNRYEICTSHDIPFQTIQKEFASRDDVKLWMMNNQLARRNLNDFQRVEITHKCEDAVRAKAEQRRLNNLVQNTEREIFPTRQGRANDELGAIAGVSGKTYEHAVTVIEEAPEPVVEAARQNALSINAAYQVTKMEPEQQREIGERIERGEKPKDVVSDVQHRPHVTNNSGCNEWYTPERYLDLSREVLGEIDLDPASCVFANETVKAQLFYSENDDGLTKPWHGRVWMNPPYSSELVPKFTEKFVDEYNDGNIAEGIVLVNNATETAWFTNMVNAASAVCFPRGRIRYYSQTRESLAPLQGQAFLYFGENKEKFLDVFSEIGWGAVIYV